MNFNYCPNCGQQASVQRFDDTNYECTNCQWHYWNNPKTAVGVVFLKDGQMLVSERGRDPKKGMYDFPGGFLDYIEDPAKAAIREVQEETGLIVKELILVDVAAAHEYMPGTSAADIIFAVTEWEGTPVASDDSASLVWKPIDFMYDPSFAWPYPGLAEKLNEL